MNKIRIKKLLVIPIILFFLTIIFFSTGVKASQYFIANALDVTFPENSLFNAQNLAPGDKISKTISVKNEGIYPHSFSIATSGKLNSLADILQMEAKIDDNIIWSKKLSQIAQSPGSSVIISKISPGESVDVALSVILPNNAGNEYMSSSINDFMFYVGIEDTDPKEPPGANNISGNNQVAVAGFNDDSAVQRSTASNQRYSQDDNQNLKQAGQSKSEVKGLRDKIINANLLWLLFPAIVLLILSFIFYKRSKNKKEPSSSKK